MTHQKAREAAELYTVGLYTFRELDDVCHNEGLRDVRVTTHGTVQAIGGKGLDTYVVRLVEA